VTLSRLGLALFLLVSLPALAQAPQPPAAPEPAPAAPPAPPAPAAPAAAPAAPAATPAPPPTPAEVDRLRSAQVSTLKLLREKNVITEEEYQSALKDLGELGARAKDTNTFVMGKLTTSVYGFVEMDALLSSTQSFGNDFAGNTQVARPNTFAATHGRLTFTTRDSRLGFRLSAPAPAGVTATAVFEGDFLGSEPGIFQNTGGTAPVAGTTNSEAAFFVNPTFRIRHAYLKAETPVVDLTVGQTWNLLGWQPVFIPAVVQWPGLVGELYGRSPQVRLSKTFKSELVTVDAAVAALRPVQRDSSIPNGEAGVRVSFPKWAGVHSAFLTGTSALPLSIAVTGDVRAFRIPEFLSAPVNTNNATGGAFAVDAYVPIIPGTLANRGNSLSLTAEFVRGAGIADQYTAFASGISNPALPPDPVTGVSPAFQGHVDGNLAAYDASGTLHLIQVQTMFASLEYYLPVLEGKIGLMGGYYQTDILNTDEFATAAAARRRRESMTEAGLLFDPIPSLRFAVDTAVFRDAYADATTAWNWSVLGSAFFFF
jgi:hypothetical protein